MVQPKSPLVLHKGQTIELGLKISLVVEDLNSYAPMSGKQYPPHWLTVGSNVNENLRNRNYKGYDRLLDEVQHGLNWNYGMKAYNDDAMLLSMNNIAVDLLKLYPPVPIPYPWPEQLKLYLQGNEQFN